MSLDDIAEDLVSFEHSAIQFKARHSSKECYSKFCPLHNRSAHHLRDMPQAWNNFEQIVIRECSHGNWHPDPDERPGFKIHDCDGCCIQVVPLINKLEPDLEKEAYWASSGLTLLHGVLTEQSQTFLDSGSFENSVFIFNDYCWCDGDRAGHEESCPPNFLYKNLNISFEWYKHIGRGITSSNKEPSATDWYLIINSCINSLKGTSLH
jgi:hypothetical protein